MEYENSFIGSYVDIASKFYHLHDTYKLPGVLETKVNKNGEVETHRIFRINTFFFKTDFYEKTVYNRQTGTITCFRSNLSAPVWLNLKEKIQITYEPKDLEAKMKSNFEANVLLPIMPLKPYFLARYRKFHKDEVKNLS